MTVKNRKTSDTVFHKLFFLISRNISFGAGIASFSLLGAWFAVAYGYFYIKGSTPFFPGEFNTFTWYLAVYVAILSLYYLIQSGLLYPLGFPGIHSEYRLVNRYMDRYPGGEHFAQLESSQLLDLSNALMRLPRVNASVVFLCSLTVIIPVSLLDLKTYHIPQHRLFISIGGIIAAIINGYFGFTISEFWVGPVRKKVHETLFHRNVKFEKHHIFSYKKNSSIIILFILLTLMLLTQYMAHGHKSFGELFIFFFLTLFTMGFILGMFLNTINLFLEELNESTRQLAEKGTGLLFPQHGYKELITASLNYNRAAAEIQSIRDNLEQIIEDRTTHLTKAKLDAENANKSKSQFLANMSHEIRTPLNGIMGLVDVILNSGLNEQQTEYLNLIKSSGKSLLDIINEVLDISRVEAGKIELEAIPFNLRSVIKESVETVIGIAQNKGLLLETDIDPHLPEFIVGDAIRLRQVLVNLLGNAVKFTEKGLISISVKRETSSNASTESDPPLETGPVGVSFSVSDTGIGIQASKIDTIFSSFTQADGSMTRKFGGTGLGLTISQQLVFLMGGIIQVESQENQGSRFFFTIRCPIPEKGFSLPPIENTPENSLHPQESTQPSPQAPAKPDSSGIVNPIFSGIRILLVEDNEINRKLVHALMKKKGWNMDSVINGRLACELLKEINDRTIENPTPGSESSHQSPYDLILMDIQMPEMDGIAATKVIRQYEIFEKTPIIAISAHAIKGDRERFIDAGMDDYLSKPIDARALFNMMETYLIKSSPGKIKHETNRI